MRIKSIIKILFLICAVIFLFGCATVQPSDCQIEKVYEPRLVETSEQFDKYTFKIMYNNCHDHDRKGMLANKVLEEYKDKNKYKKFVITNISVTKLYNGQLYSVLFLK